MNLLPRVAGFTAVRWHTRDAGLPVFYVWHSRLSHMLSILLQDA